MGLNPPVASPTDACVSSDEPLLTRKTRASGTAYEKLGCALPRISRRKPPFWNKTR